MEYIDLREVYADPAARIDASIGLQGWIRNHRRQRANGFIDFYDGTVQQGIQIVYDADTPGFSEIQALRPGAAVSVCGMLRRSGRGGLELHARSIVLEGDSPEDYPLQPKRHTVEFLRQIAYLRPRTRLFQAVFRVRSAAAAAIHRYFTDNGYVYVHTPILTANDGEGAGNTFTVTTLDPAAGAPDYARDFFGKKTSLAVTGQLEGETFALAFKKIYTFGPTFRAEDSNTKTHAAEFWMIEPEIAFCDLQMLMDIEEAFLKHVVASVLEQCRDELAFLDDYTKSGLVEKLRALAGGSMARVSHAEAVEILQRSGVAFEYPPQQGRDLAREHEKYLTDVHFKSPVFVYDWPAEIKAFYMRQNDDGRTVAAVDLLVPLAGELMGGSQREERYDRLRARMEALGMDIGEMEWYLNLRRFGGCKHAGFGMGFERLLIYLTGVDNIRDVIPYPRTPGNCEF